MIKNLSQTALHNVYKVSPYLATYSVELIKLLTNRFCSGGQRSDLNEYNKNTLEIPQSQDWIIYYLDSILLPGVNDMSVIASVCVSVS